MDASMAKQVLHALRMRGHQVGQVYPDGDPFNMGHALVLCRGRNLGMPQERQNEAFKRGISLWCGVDPRCNGAALGY